MKLLILDAGETTRRVEPPRPTSAFMARCGASPRVSIGELLALMPRKPDGTFAVCFGAQHIVTINLHDETPS